MNGAHHAQESDAFERALTDRLRRFDCPPSQSLGEYALGVLPGDARASLVEHVSGCVRCSEELATLRRFMATEPEPAVSLGERLRRVVATLVPTSRASAGAAVRGGDAATRMFRAEQAVVTLTSGPTSRRDRSSLHGLIWQEGEAPLSLEGAEASLVVSNVPAKSVSVTEFGNFEFQDFAPGIYSLEIRLVDRILVVEELKVE